MTFDNVPWVITMKKNDHYFPMVELIRDPSESSGWRKVSYEQGKAIEGEGHEGINGLQGGDVSLDMDEGMEDMQGI